METSLDDKGYEAIGVGQMVPLISILCGVSFRTGNNDHDGGSFV